MDYRAIIQKAKNNSEKLKVQPYNILLDLKKDNHAISKNIEIIKRQLEESKLKVIKEKNENLDKKHLKNSQNKNSSNILSKSAPHLKQPLKEQTSTSFVINRSHKSNSSESKSLSNNTTNNNSKSGSAIDKAILSNKTTNNNSKSGSEIHKAILSNKTTNNNSKSGSEIHKAIFSNKTTINNSKGGSAIDKAILSNKTTNNNSKSGSAIDKAILSNKTTNNNSKSGSAIDKAILSNKPLLSHVNQNKSINLNDNIKSKDNTNQKLKKNEESSSKIPMIKTGKLIKKPQKFDKSLINSQNKYSDLFKTTQKSAEQKRKIDGLSSIVNFSKNTSTNFKILEKSKINNKPTNLTLPTKNVASNGKKYLPGDVRYQNKTQTMNTSAPKFTSNNNKPNININSSSTKSITKNTQSEVKTFNSSKQYKESQNLSIKKKPELSKISKQIVSNKVNNSSKINTSITGKTTSITSSNNYGWLKNEKSLSGWDLATANLKRKNVDETKKRGFLDYYKKNNENDDDNDDCEDDEYDSEMEDFICDDDEDDEYNRNSNKYNNNYSKYIREIFKYNPEHYKHINDEDDPNMETSYHQIMKEERKSAKLGFLEDLEDMKKEEEEKKKNQLNKSKKVKSS